MESAGVVLTATKMSAPGVTSHLVERSRLTDRLDLALADRLPLVLVSAPAGSGKSTLLSSWMTTVDATRSWLQLDESDTDPARFWAYVGGALASAVPGAPQVVRAALPAGVDAVVAALVNEIAIISNRVVLVLDDYHLVEHDDVHRGVELLVTRAPANLTVVVSTRVDPPFRLGRLRVRDRIAEIRGSDLRFDSGEASELLGDRLGELDRAAVDRLTERTEGWAAGLVLAGLSMRHADDALGFVASFSGDDHLVADYLSDELLRALDPGERRRLLEVSVLANMSGPLVDAVCGSDDAADWLRRLAAENQLVIGLDRSGTWFRFHHLLRDLLRLEAERAMPDRLPDLHRAAGRWHRELGELDRAIEHLLTAGDLVDAADLIADNATKLLNRGEVLTVIRYLDRLGDVAERHGGAAIVRGWISFVIGRFGEAERWLAIASDLDDGEDAGLIAALSTMIHVAAGDLTSALAAAQRSPEPSEPTNAMVLGAVRVLAGLFDEARPHLERAEEMALARPDHFTAAVTPLFRALVEIELGHDALAAELARRGLEHADRCGIPEAAQLALGHSVLARTTGDPVTAAAEARRGVELARRSPENVALSYALASAGDVLCGQGDPDGAELLDEARRIVDRCTDPGIAGRYLARVESRHGRAKRPVSPTDVVEELTDRELAVLRYLPSPMSQREIASELFVSLNTVKTHCRAIYRKLGVDGRKPAVQSARELGLL